LERDSRLKKSNRKTKQPSGKWITARKTVQYIFLALFLVLLIWARREAAPELLSNLPMLLDPLLQISYLLASRTFLLVSSLALIVIILSLVFGRVWCGWVCPLGTVLDIFSLKSWRKEGFNNRKPDETWRAVKYGLLISTLVAALFGNLTLLIFDPITILFRTLTGSLWPGLDTLVTKVEFFLYRIPPLSEPIATFDSLVRPRLFPSEPLFYKNALLYGGIFFGIVLLNLAAPRFWCRYLCPLGGMLGVLSKIALFRRQISGECPGCTLCTQVCPTGTIDPQRNYASDPSECTMCLDCLESCPRSAIVFSPKLSPSEWREYDPTRRQFITTTGLTIAALALNQIETRKKVQHPHLLRPPGTTEDEFLSKCIRCSECMRVCPTGALQPLTDESTIDAIWTPVVVPRVGYCDYSCSRCGIICPVEAIPELSLGDKRLQIIGKAYIDQNRCLAWSDGTECLVCEEMCPIPEKAIRLESSSQLGPDGESIDIKLPYVLRELCIGCGICEYKCPVAGEAAIRVFIPNLEVPI